MPRINALFQMMLDEKGAVILLPDRSYLLALQLKSKENVRDLDIENIKT